MVLCGPFVLGLFPRGEGKDRGIEAVLPVRVGCVHATDEEESRVVTGGIWGCGRVLGPRRKTWGRSLSWVDLISARDEETPTRFPSWLRSAFPDPPRCFFYLWAWIFSSWAAEPSLPLGSGPTQGRFAF